VSTYRYRPYTSESSWPPVITNLLIANAIAFFVPILVAGENGVALFRIWAGLWPLGTDAWAQARGALGGFEADFWPWQLLTYGFLHGDHMHLLFNMIGLYLFGRELENRWGSARFLKFYLICVGGAGLIQLAIASSMLASGMTPPYPTVGASGGVYGVLLAFAWMFPRREIMLLFPPIPLQARYLVMILGAVSLFGGFSGIMPGIAHFAHLGGMLFGWLIILYWRGKLPLKPKERMWWG